MDYRPLGITGLKVSAISLGTVELGVDYGIPIQGDFGRPTVEVAMEILLSAHEAGINLFDTAPAYGVAEELLGQALGNSEKAIFATKVSLPRDASGKLLRGTALKSTLTKSLDSSRKTLRRDKLDIVQLHNPTIEDIATHELTDLLWEARAKGKIGFVGASVYTVREALAAIESGHFSTIQVAFSLLDRRMLDSVFPAANKAGVGIITRSALLKGVLTEKALHIPVELAPLGDAAKTAREMLGVSWHDLPGEAVRYCLGERGVATVLVGVRSVDELHTAIMTAGGEPLTIRLREQLSSITLADERLLNPSTWPL